MLSTFSRSRLRTNVAAPAVLALALLQPVAAWAVEPPQMSTQFKIDHADPEANIPGIKERNDKPIEFGYYLQDLAAFAVAARRAGNRALEARYYLAFAKAVPDRANGYAKACEALEAANKRDEAIAACQSALGLEGVELKDYVRFVHLMIGRPTPLTAAERDELARTVAHLQSDPPSRIAGLHLQCELALHVADYGSLDSCARGLERVAPNDTKTITFLWALASHEGNHTDAQILIERARMYGVAPATIARMERMTRSMGWRRYLSPPRVVWAAGIVTLVALAAGGILLVTRRLRRDRHQSVASARP